MYAVSTTFIVRKEIRFLFVQITLRYYLNPLISYLLTFLIIVIKVSIIIKEIIQQEQKYNFQFPENIIFQEIATKLAFFTLIK